MSVEKILAIALKFSSAISLVFFLGTVDSGDSHADLYPGCRSDRAGGAVSADRGSVLPAHGDFPDLSVHHENSGYTLKSTVIGSVSMVTNIVLNAVFIFGVWKVPG